MFIRKARLWLTLLILVSAEAQAVQYQAAKDAGQGGPVWHWPEGKRGAVSLSFDDARPSQVDSGVPLLDRYHVRATFFVSPDRLADRLEVWKRAVAGGHEIGNHSLVHPCSGNFPWARHKALENYTLEQMRAELAAANQRIRETLGVVPTSFAYPCGQTFVGRGTNLKSYVPLVAETFKASRLWLGESSNDPSFCDMAQILSVPSDDVDFDHLKPTIEQAMKNGQWLVLAGHDIAESGPRQVTRLKMLEELCRYVSDPRNGIWIDTIDRVASYILAQRAEPKAEAQRPAGARDNAATASPGRRLVELSEVNPRIVQDLRYATPNNFLKTAVYTDTRCRLLPSLAAKLNRAQQALEKEGLGLKVYDCYRPPSVQKKMWALVPDERYVANPNAGGSNHNRGAAVDLTLVDGSGHELEMPTGFDAFTPEAAHYSQAVAPEKRAHRMLLRQLMEQVGLEAMETEWWHYQLPGAKSLPIVE
ncbi:MAG: D-alanyl-D-alanine dipeptidase [Acidobacteriota bacterium]